MKCMNIAKAVAFLGIAGLAVSHCAADTFVNTIGDGSKYQVNGEISRPVSIGYDKYAWSGDLTGSRPTGLFATDTSSAAVWSYANSTQTAAWGTTQYGTTGVPGAQILVATTGSDGKAVSVAVTGTGRPYAGWVVQPFTPTTGGTAQNVSFIAQFRTPAWYIPTIFGGPARPSTAYVGIIDAPTDGKLPVNLWSLTSPSAVDLSSAKVGKIVSATVSKQLTANSKYWVVIAPQSSAPQMFGTSVLDYANLNWAWASTFGSSMPCALYSGDNGSTLVPLTKSVLGIQVTGTVQAPATPATVASAKGMADGTLVTIQDGAYLSAKSNPDGLFYLETADRLTGLRIIGNAGTIALNNKVGVVGNVTTVGAEKAITLSSAPTDLSAPSEIRALGMASTSVGLLNNVGLVVRVWGKVQNGSGSTFTLIDGTGTGVQCSIIDSSISLPADGSYIGITGVSSKATGTLQVLVTGTRTYQP